MVKNESYSVKREITNAVMKLMAEKNYMDISVTDIVKTAGVARASFYRNFDSINDVIESVSDEISDELITDVIPVLYSTDERKWREFLFNHFYLFSKIQKDTGPLRAENLSALLTRIDALIEQKTPQLQTGIIHDKYLSVAKMGLLMNITKKWLNSGTEETPEEMINYIMSFITLF